MHKRALLFIFGQEIGAMAQQEQHDVMIGNLACFYQWRGISLFR